MSDSPDPTIVREIARKHLSNFLRKYPMVDAFFVGSVVLEACGDPELWQNDRDAYNAWCSAVVDEIRVALPSWPTEQPQDAHPLDPARKTCLDCGHYFLAHRSDVGCTHCECKAGIAAGHVAEQPQDDGDVRAVAALATADNDEELDRAVSDLIARFADRIEALEARDTKGGEQQ